MPLYEYECDACGQRFEVIQKFSDPAPAACAKCGKGPVQRLMSSPAIQFKGSGWYITDYARKGRSSESEGGKSEAGKSEGGKSEGAKKGSGSESASPSSEAGGEAKKSEAAPAATPAPAADKT